MRYSHKLLRERFTLLLVFSFCIFVSSSEYFVEEAFYQEAENVEVAADGEKQSPENKAFLHAAMDAVVPFVVHTVDQTFHFIYEIIGYKDLDFHADFNATLSYNQLFEVLFEQIISVNAP